MSGVGVASECASVRRLLYVSCGFPALARDLATLTAPRPGGRRPVWRLAHAEGHVLFPGSDHLETLAVFDRVADADPDADDRAPRDDRVRPPGDRRR